MSSKSAGVEVEERAQVGSAEGERVTTQVKATNITWHAQNVSKAQRAALKAQKPCILWLTGLSGSGKSTIANALEVRLNEMGYHTYLLDGDNVRHGLNRDLGFSDADRTENIRRIGEAAKLFVDAGIIVLTAFISPFRSDRQMVRDMVEDDELIEIFVDTPLDVCEQRDPKGLYRKARAGEIKNFTGLDSPYEPPVVPEVHLHPDLQSVDESTQAVVEALLEKQVLQKPNR